MSRRAAAARLLATTAAVVWSFAAMESGAQTGAIEEVVVTAATGSRIVRQGDSPSPLSSYDGQTLLDSGLKDLRDLVGVLSINAGAENNSDNLTQNYTVGTANINLRGLGVASSLGRNFADPDCEQYAGLLQALPGDSSICRFDYGPQLTGVPNEQRLQTWGRLDWASGDGGNFWAELGYSSNDINRDVSPSFPVLSTPVIPAYHPGNPFGEDVYFEGRITDTSSWNVSLVRAQNDTLQNPRDVIAENFQAALLGFGGSDCDANPLDAAPEQAGTGGCLFFNPFSSNFAAGPGEALHNSPALRPFIIGDYFGDGQSQLTTLEANVTGFLPWRDAGYAAGVQYRDQSVDFFYDDITRNDGSRTFAGRRTLGDPNLKPETSSALNAGVSWQSAGNLTINADFWRYSFEDVLRKENAQAIVNAGSYDPRSSDPQGRRLFVSFGLRR